jgi:uncharacterized DUF497 family protein
MTPFDGFEWDDGNREKCQKHGVSVAEIEAALSGRPAILPDLEHSQAETRFLAVGRSGSGRHVFVAFTIREHEGGRHLRPISARHMHQEEIEHYEATRPEA